MLGNFRIVLGFNFFPFLDLQMEKGCFVGINLVFYFFKLKCLITVFLQFFEIRFPFLEDDLRIVEFFFNFIQFQNRFMLFLFIDGNIADLFNDLSPVERRHRHEAGDIPLENDVIPFGIDFGEGEKIQHFRTCFFLAVDTVNAISRFGDGPFNDNFFCVERERFVFVGEGNFHGSCRCRAFVFSSVKYQVGCLLGAHGFCGKTSENETDGIADVALSRAVRT